MFSVKDNPKAKGAIGDDVLFGCEAISRFLFGTFSGETKRWIYRTAAARRLPIKKMGATLIASKTQLMAAYQRLTAADE